MRGRRMEIAALPAIDRLAGEIPGAGIGERDLDAMLGFGDGQKAHVGFWGDFLAGFREIPACGAMVLSYHAMPRRTMSWLTDLAE